MVVTTMQSLTLIGIVRQLLTMVKTKCQLLFPIGLMGQSLAIVGAIKWSLIFGQFNGAVITFNRLGTIFIHLS